MSVGFFSTHRSCSVYKSVAPFGYREIVMSSDSMRGPKTPLDRALETMKVHCDQATHRKAPKGGGSVKTHHHPAADSRGSQQRQHTAVGKGYPQQRAAAVGIASGAKGGEFQVKQLGTGGKDQATSGHDSMGSDDPKTRGIIQMIASAFGLLAASLKLTAADCAMLTLPCRAVERNEYIWKIFGKSLEDLMILDAYSGAGGDMFSFMKLGEQLINDPNSSVSSVAIVGAQPVVDGRYERLRSNVKQYLAVHRNDRIRVDICNATVEKFLSEMFGGCGAKASFHLIYADPPWPTPSSDTTAVFIGNVKRTVFDTLAKIGAPPAAYICLKAPTPFVEFSGTLFQSSTYLSGYVFDKEIKMFNRRGKVVGYFHFLRFVGSS
jgi:hypothetical protein